MPVYVSDLKLGTEALILLRRVAKSSSLIFVSSRWTAFKLGSRGIDLDKAAIWFGVMVTWANFNY